MKNIIFDETHDEIPAINDTKDSGLSVLCGELKKAGYAVRPTKAKITDNLRDANVLWISLPTTGFDDAERAAVVDFVKRGGGLLLTAEWGNIGKNVAALNAISKSFGIIFGTDCVTDPRSSYTAKDMKGEKHSAFGKMSSDAKIPHFLYIRNFKMHPITDQIKEIAYYEGCSITSKPDSTIAWSGSESFGDLNFNEKLDPGERLGPAGLVCAAQHERGRVVCIGDTSIITNGYIVYADNRQFDVNIFRWLLKEI